MERQRVSSGARWEPVVGYSRAVRAGPWVCVAGTTAAAEGGGAVGGDDAAAQTREALRRVRDALEQLGARLEDVVRTRLYVTDMDRWEEVGRVHGEVFGAIRPASTLVEVSRLVDPALLVEVEADALLAGATWTATTRATAERVARAALSPAGPVLRHDGHVTDERRPSRRAPVTTRSMSTPRPGWSLQDAVRLAEQGYALEQVERMTGFARAHVRAQLPAQPRS